MATETETKSGSQTVTATPGGKEKPEGETDTGGVTENSKTPQTPTTKEPEPEKQVSQSQVNAIVKKAREDEAARIRKQIDDENAEKNGEFEQLAASRKLELETTQAELQTVRTTMASLVDGFSAFVLSELRALPVEVRGLCPLDLPEDETGFDDFKLTEDDLALMAKWIPKGRAVVKKMSEEVEGEPGTKKGYLGGPPRKPNKEKQEDSKTNNDIVTKKRGESRYSV